MSWKLLRHINIPLNRRHYKGPLHTKAKLNKEGQEIIHQTKLVLRLLDLSFVRLVSDRFSFGSHAGYWAEKKRMFNFPEISCVCYCKAMIY